MQLLSFDLLMLHVSANKAVVTILIPELFGYSFKYCHYMYCM